MQSRCSHARFSRPPKKKERKKEDQRPVGNQVSSQHTTVPGENVWDLMGYSESNIVCALIGSQEELFVSYQNHGSRGICARDLNHVPLDHTALIGFHVLFAYIGQAQKLVVCSTQPSSHIPSNTQASTLSSSQARI